MSTREEYHKEISQSLQEKDEYRKQIRELGERCDEVQVQLLRAQGKVLSLQTQLRRQNCPYQVLREALWWLFLNKLIKVVH